MKTIILPGYSPKNKEWGIELAKHLNNSVFHEWKHWDNETKLDPAFEAEKIRPKIKKEKINILAKSIGTWFAVNLIREKGVSIDKIILCGIPLHDISDKEKDEYNSLIEIAPENILVIQNLEDPHASSHEVKDFLKKINPDIKVVEKNRGDHEYPYFYSFKEFLQ